MPPVVAAVVAVAQTAFTAFAAFIGSKAIAAAIVKIAISVAVSAAASALFSPKLPDVFQRQADVLTLQLGETPRAAVFGKAAVGGTLADAFNHGTNNEWETVIVCLADHECEALEGFIIQDEEYAFSADGAQGFTDGGNEHLYIYWKPGEATQTALSWLTSNSGGRWTSNDVLNGVSYVVAAYRKSDTVWKAGRPRFRWILKGKKLYDPRLDDTVTGGSGAHRWADESTYEWSENAALCEYNWRRGIYSRGQLMVGPGRSELEAPPEEMFSALNLCDEDVDLAAGGTVKRYTASAVVFANERWIDTQKEFARCMGGDLIDRAGVTVPDPGVAKTPEFTFTDADLISEARCEYRRFLSRDELVNTVTTRYVEPAKLWQPHSAPLRRDQDDIDADGEVRDAPLDLGFVSSFNQAQRVGEIARRRARLQRQATVTLGPEFMGHETGDWINWQSDLYLGGATITFEVRRVRVYEDGTVELGLREIASSVFAWDETTDELDETSAGFVAGDGAPTFTLGGFGVSATTLTNGGVVVPGIAASWSVLTDYTAKLVLVEWRKDGTTSPVYSKVVKYDLGATTLAEGLVSAATFNVRATVICSPERDTSPTSWSNVTIATAVSGATAQGVGVNSIIDPEFRVPATYWQAFVSPAGSITNTVASANGVRYYQSAATGMSGASILNQRAVVTSQANVLTVVGGQKVEVSAYFGGVNLTTVDLYVHWLDAAGAGISFSAAQTGVSLTGFAGAGDLSTYQRAGGIVTAPSTARYARLYANVNTSSATATARMAKPFLAYAGANQTDLTPWNASNDSEPGANVTETRTAAAISGQGDLATTNLVALPFGQNGLTNTELLAPGTWPATGWENGWNGNTGFTPARTLITSGSRYAVEIAITGTPANATVFDTIACKGHASAVVADLRRYAMPCVAGDRIGARALVAHNASCTQAAQAIVFVDSAGAYISEAGGTAVINSADGSTGNPGNYAAVTSVGTAPANARFALFVVRVVCNGGANPKAWVMAPMLCRMGANQTAVPPYAPGAPDRLSDQTSANTAAAIASQGALATLSTVSASVLAAGVGHNSILDPEFRTPSTYWDSVASPAGSVVKTVSAANGVRYYESAASGMSGASVVVVRGNSTQNFLSVTDGQKVEVSGYWGGVNVGNLDVYVLWLDSSGAALSFSLAQGVSLSGFAGAGALSTYLRIGGIVTAPTNARYAVLYVNANTSSATATVRLAKPYIGYAGTAQTALTPWNAAADSEPGANITETRTSAAITSQTAWATYGGHTPSGALAYINTLGRVTDWRGVPTNGLGGAALARSAASITGGGGTGINIAAVTLYVPGETSIALPSGSFSGLAGSTKHYVFYDRTNNDYVYETTFSAAAGKMNDATGRYVYIGARTTGGGTFDDPGGGVTP